ncbi:MAG: hypothetical protein ACKVOX_12365 [Rhizobacter sp.]
MSLRSGRLFGVWSAALVTLLSALPAHAQGDSAVVYRCPGNLYTSAITAKEAKDQGCRTLDGAPVTVITAPKRPVGAAAGGSASPPAPRPDARVDPGEQRARDSDARRILEAELQREEQRLAEMQAEYNKGEPERRGDERNYQKYLDRTSDLKSGIARKESDIAALKRELSKLP